jgi:hypothetical protein
MTLTRRAKAPTRCDHVRMKREVADLCAHAQRLSSSSLISMRSVMEYEMCTKVPLVARVSAPVRGRTVRGGRTYVSPSSIR